MKIIALKVSHLGYEPRGNVSSRVSSLLGEASRMRKIRKSPAADT
jgi:hypothetical protein